MFFVRVEADFAAAHFLKHYHGKCERLHGHSKLYRHAGLPHDQHHANGAPASKRGECLLADAHCLGWHRALQFLDHHRWHLANGLKSQR